MSKTITFAEFCSAYNQETIEMLERVRADINEDAIFSKLEEQYNVYDLLNFNEFTMADRLERLSYHIKDFRLKYLQEMAKVEQVRDRLEKTIGDRYVALKTGEVNLTKQEIERYYLPRDPDIITLKGLLRKQELRAKYFEAIAQALDKMNWNIKAWLDASKGGY